MKFLFAAALFGLLVLVVRGQPALASHPYPGPDIDDCHEPCLWTNLLAGGTGHLQYSICGDGTPQEANWDDGIENWDAAIGPLMEFDPAACGLGVQLKWETAANECGGGIACWDDSHTDVGSYWRLDSAIIWFDKGQYVTYSTNWQINISAHEWGHNLNMDHHPTSVPCTENSVMAYVGGQECLKGPSANDVTTAWCISYRTCTWQGWSPWGAYATPAPGGMAVEHHLSRPDFVHMVRSSSPDIYERYWNGSAWTGWLNRSSDGGDPGFSGAVAISLNDNETHLVGSTGAGDLYHKKRVGQGAWSSWSYVGMPHPLQPINGPIAVSNSGSRIDIVGVSNNISVFHRFSINGGQTWQTWEDRGGWGTLGGSIAISTRVGNIAGNIRNIHIVALRPSDGMVWMTWWNGAGWQGWEYLSGPVNGSLAIDTENAPLYNTTLTPHVGVSISAVSGTSVYVKCWHTYCSGAWDYHNSGLMGPLAIMNAYGEARFAGRQVDVPANLWTRWRSP